MKRCLRLFVVCAVVLVMATVAMAQQKPEPVIRLGDWVEIGNEAFMNIIASGDMRFNTSNNLDFEDRLRDRSNDRDPFSTSMHDQEGDHFYVEARWGADFRYQKNFRFQILFEWQGTLDGNLIDDRHNATTGGTDAFGRAAPTERAVAHADPRFDAEAAQTPLRLNRLQQLIDDRLRTNRLRRRRQSVGARTPRSAVRRVTVRRGESDRPRNDVVD